jgi:hypothetical protein
MEPSFVTQIDFHVPEMLLGQLLETNSRKIFYALKDRTEKFIKRPVFIPIYGEDKLLVKDVTRILDDVNSTQLTLSFENAHDVLTEFFKYLRIMLLSTKTNEVWHTVYLLDSLVKNFDYRIHVHVGQRRMMQTLGIVARRNITRVKISPYNLHTFYSTDVLKYNPDHGLLSVFELIVDCIQGWGKLSKADIDESFILIFMVRTKS